MYDLEAMSQGWKDTIDWMKQQIKDNPDSIPFKSPYTLAKAEGSYMSINFKIKDRDRAQGFLDCMLYREKDKEALEDLLGIEVHEVCMGPNNVTANLQVYDMLSTILRYCVANNLIDVNTFISTISE